MLSFCCLAAGAPPDTVIGFMSFCPGKTPKDGLMVESGLILLTAM
jgi:hypothetical protein